MNGSIRRLLQQGILVSGMLCAGRFAHAQGLDGTFTSLGFTEKTFTSPNGGSLPYKFLPPAGYDATKKYPLVLVLHFGGSTGEEEVRPFAMADRQAAHPAFVVAPYSDCGHYCWGGSPALWGQGDLEPHQRMAVELVDALSTEFSVDTDRLYITGDSMGGWGSWDIVMRFQNKFAAILGMDSAGDAARAEKILDMRVWSCEGDMDMSAYDVNVGQVVQARALRDRLMALGHKDFKYNEFPGAHGAGYACAEDPTMPDWMFGAVRSGATVTPPGSGGSGSGGGAAVGTGGVSNPSGTGGVGSGGTPVNPGNPASGGAQNAASGGMASGPAVGGARPVSSATGGNAAVSPSSDGAPGSQPTDSTFGTASKSSCDLGAGRTPRQYSWLVFGLAACGALLQRRFRANALR